MKNTKFPPEHRCASQSSSKRIRRSWPLQFSIRVGAILTLTLLLAGTLIVSSTASARRGRFAASRTQSSQLSPRPTLSSMNKGSRAVEGLELSRWRNLSAISIPAPLTESVSTFESTCTTPKTSFNLGETVCARIVGAPLGDASRRAARLGWVSPYGSLAQGSEITSDPQTGLYAIPNAATQTFTDAGGGTVTVDNRGTWRVVVSSAADGSLRQAALFTVHDPAKEYVDLSVRQAVGVQQSEVEAGSSSVFTLYVSNTGPDTAHSVVLSDVVPANTTFTSITENTSLGFTCGAPVSGTFTCTAPSLPSGATGQFTFLYAVVFGTPEGTQINNTASVTSSATPCSPASTCELQANDNSFTATATVPADPGSPNCALNCPSGQTVNNEAGQGGAHVTFASPASVGSCGDLTCTSQSGDFFPVGTTMITCTSTTNDTCSFFVTVNDTEDPVIGNCPANISVTEDGATPGEAIVNYTTPGATDNSGAATVTCSTPSGSSFTVAGSPHPVTCRATDAAGNSDSCSFNVTVTAAGASCSLTPPANVTADYTSTAPQCGANVTYSAPTTSGSCGIITCDHASGSFFPVGTTTVTCSDPSGATTQFTVTVNDTTAPVPDVPNLPTITRGCAVTVDVPTATDDCAGQVGGATSDPRTYDQPGTYTIHWTYTNESGVSSSQNQTVVITNDTTPPVPDVATLPQVTGECSATVTSVPTATDDCSGADIEGTTSDPLTYTGAGTYTVHWTYTDAAGNSSTQNQTVVVTDTVPPTIALVGASSITVECHTSFTDPGVTTTDNCVPKVVSVATTGTVNVNATGTYTLTYTATDGGGNQASVQRTVIVADTIAPVITLNGASSMTVECHTSFTDPGATASDACDSSVPVSVSGSVNVNTPGIYALNYNGSDDSGNAAATVTRTVTVVDTTPPTISCPSPITVYLPLNSSATSMVVNYTAPVGSDSCGGAVTTMIAGLPSGASFPVGTTTNTFRVTDGANNSASCSFTVTVLYNFTGFFPPVSNPPVLNAVNAGRAIPVKFSLSGNKGLNIFAANSPYTVSLNCDTNDPGVDVIGTTEAGGSTLSYGGDTYNYVWKTESSWAGTCRQLVVKLNDGSVHTANFRFR